MNFPLTETELLQKLRTGEDSFTQYKSEVKHTDSLAEEMVGIAEDETGRGKVVGVQNLKSLNNHISNASSENTVPAIIAKTESLVIDDKVVVVIQVEEGNQKPYRTKGGKYIVRSGADKRAVSQEELSRMFQASGNYHIEELAVRGAAIETELDRFKFSEYFEKNFNGQSLVSYLEENEQGLHILLTNLGIAINAQLNLVGLLFFAKNPQRLRPLLEIKAVSFYGNDLADTRYIANNDIGGTLDQQFERAVNFVVSNLLKQQPAGEGFNSRGILEISKIALEEAIANALVHRNYDKAGSVRIFVFQNRVEIISPGAMPNHLTIEQVKNGNAIPKNPILLGYAIKLMPYRGTGSGIRRMIQEHPNTELINDREGQQFKVIFWR